MGRLRRIPWGIYQRGKKLIGKLPGGSGLLAWTDPLHIARLLLQKAIEERAGFVRGAVLDLGCGAVPYRHLFAQADRYIGLDLPPNQEADVLGTALCLPFRDSIFDAVLCSEVLEHVPEPADLLRQVYRVLKPGGVLLLTTPQTWGPHLEPFDFYRYTKHGLRYLAEKSNFHVVEIVPTCGMWATVAQRISDTVVFQYAEGRSQWLIEFLSLLLSPVLMTGYGLDKLFGKRGDTLDHILLAEKPDGSVTEKRQELARPGLEPLQ